MQTAYELAAFGTRIEALDTGTTMRHSPGSTVRISVPPEICWAYPAASSAMEI